ncbi:MAG: hypothetical protein SVO01_04055 [Thermotogota bacterium]|nr:hypothetical protein [Thermotogota bacterium]
MSLKDIFQLLIQDYWRNIQKRESLTGLSEECHWYDALIHFKNYAYERNMTGAISRYKEIADIVLEPLRNRERWSASIEETIWDNFKDQCSNKKIKHNEQVDPLKPSAGNKKSLEKFVCDLTDDKNYTIAIWAFNMLSQNQLKEAHRQLKTVWGIGDKIASFYLRDIFWLGNNLSPNKPVTEIDNLYLIQPVDIWVERAAKAIGCEEESKTKIATSIASFEHELGLPPGGGNIGFWMLGSNYLDDENDFNNVLSAINNLSENSKEHALVIADYFISYYGKFGELLKSILA